jgi:hypothetical protein
LLTVDSQLGAEVFLPSSESCIFSDQDNFLKNWFANKENAQINNRKNHRAVKHLCLDLGINCLTYDAHYFMARSREEVGYARDYMHAGPRGHELAFEKIIKDSRPRGAISMGRAWSSGNVKTGAAMRASLAAHAAARKAKNPIAKAAARAAGQASATAHCADHSMGALLYVLQIYELRGMSFERVFKAQIAKLPAKLRPMVREGILSRLSISVRSKIRLRKIRLT